MYVYVEFPRDEFFLRKDYDFDVKDPKESESE